MLKIAIIGAGSTYTPELMEGIILRRDVFPVGEIRLMDIDRRKLEIVGGLVGRMVDHAGVASKIVQTEDIDTAIADADFVFVQIRVGMLAARILDEKIPLRHGLIGQETTGIGGFFKALRTIPVLLELAQRMKQLCPNAWLLNFTNPSGICAQALLDHTDIKTIGLCNAPIGIMANPVKALTNEAAEVDYVGLNHLSFLTSIRTGGRDLLKEAVSGDDALLAKLDGQMGFSSSVLQKVGAIPSYYLHYFIHPRASLKKMLEQTETRGEECRRIEEELLALYADAGLFVKPEQLAQRGGAMYSEAACALAESIYTDDNKIHVVNAYNNGAIPFMAQGDVVETRAHVGKNGAKMIAAKETGGEYIRGLMCGVKAYEHLTVAAAVSGSRDIAIAALMANPLVADHDVACACFDEMLAAHAKFLPNFAPSK